MIHIMIRVWLLWGALTFVVQWLFGFNQWTHLWEIVQVSTPQVEAFIAGITAIGWQQLPFVLLPFFTRRAILLVVKKVGALLVYLLLVVHWRRFISTAMVLPGRMTTSGVRKVKNWHELQDSLLLRGWFLYFYTASLLTLGTFIFSEVFLALVYGTMKLPPIVVQYQAQLITFAGAYVAATIAQSLLLFVWGLLWKFVYNRLPVSVKLQVTKRKPLWFRRIVYTRRFFRRCGRVIFSTRNVLFVLFFAVFCTLPL